MLLASLACAGCASLPAQQAIVDSLDFHGNEALAASNIKGQIATQGSPRFLGLFPGVFYDYQIFNRYVLQNDLQRIERYYRARGFYDARVRAARIRYEGDRRVRVDISIEEGSPVTVKSLAMRGLTELPGNVRRAAERAALDHLRNGQRFEEADFAAAARALTRSLTESGYAYTKVERQARVDVPSHYAVLELSVSPGQRARLLRLDTVRADVHLTGGWEDRNFLGGMRRLTLQASPGLVLYPTRLPSLGLPQRLLPELSLRAELRQPGFIEARTTGFVSAEFDIYSILFAEQTTSVTLPGYREVALDVGVDRSFTRHLYVRLDHHLQLNAPFSYAGTLDDNLDRTLLLSYPELLMVLDVRDDRVEPHSGAYLSISLQAAGVGGDARDARIQPEARAYLPVLPRLTLATRATLGLLFPGNYGPPDPTADPGEYVRNTELLFFRGFFSGGPSSNRGYPPRGVGPQGSLPFFYPNQGSQDIAASCVAGLQSCSLPLGGFSLWEASAELRLEASTSVSAAVFCDASDVRSRTLDLQFLRPNLSCGPGLRYATPVGPIRADLATADTSRQAGGTGRDLPDPGRLGHLSAHGKADKSYRRRHRDMGLSRPHSRVRRLRGLRRDRQVDAALGALVDQQRDPELAPVRLRRWTGDDDYRGGEAGGLRQHRHDRPRGERGRHQRRSQSRPGAAHDARRPDPHRRTPGQPLARGGVTAHASPERRAGVRLEHSLAGPITGPHFCQPRSAAI
jgi:outer membrane protein assembly factor BamA